MEPVTEASITAMGLYDYERQRDRVISYNWDGGDVLIIDNWRMLHGRGNETAGDFERRLLRAYVQ
jgi:alpha-ketoglutarate-dependent taurine dioxygenase